MDVNSVNLQALQLRSFGRSEIGPVRRSNQDSGFYSANSVFIADGVGGSTAGDVASQTICTLMASYVDTLENINMRTLRAALTKANKSLSDLAFEHPALRGMATTFSGLFCTGKVLFAVHIGDSRIYRFRDEKLEQITRDDSWVQMLLDQGMLTDDEIATHPMRNMLLHSLSGAPQDASLAAIAPISCKVGDRWLVASDGLTSYVSQDVIARSLRRQETPEKCVDDLIKKSMSSTRDNVSVLVADVVEEESVLPQGTLLGAAAQQELTLPSWQIRA